MFYSHTLLSIKGPLGTVWYAAHIQNKLSKKHYTSTNVRSTADHIINPAVPIAFRMSAHLLLGIVRIYSKQVDYLHNDCNHALALLTKACSSIKFNVLDPNCPDPLSSVRLPKEFKLDQVPIDQDYLRLEDDPHVKPTEDITIPDVYSSESQPMDQDPASSMENTKNRGEPCGIDLTDIERMRGRDNDMRYSVLGVLMDDRIEPDPLLKERLNNDIPQDVPEDDHHSKSAEGTSVHDDAEQLTPMDQDSPARIVVEENIEREIMRDGAHDTSRGPVAPIIDDIMGDRIEPDGGLEKLYNSDASKTPNNTPPHDPHEIPSARSVDFSLRSHVRGTTASPGQVKYPVRESPEMVLLDSPKGPGLDLIERPPTPQVVQPVVRQRKRKFEIYDEATVFTNEEMKESLKDASNLLRKKRLRRIDILGVWKQQIRLKKDGVFSEPVINGVSNDLHKVVQTQIHSPSESEPSNENPEVFPESPVRVVDSSAVPESPVRVVDSGAVPESPVRVVDSGAVPESPVRVVDSSAVPESPVRVVDNDMEIEHPRNIEDSDNADNPLSKFLMPSPERKTCDSETPKSMDTSNSEPFGTSNTTEVDTTPELTGSTADPGTSTGLRGGRFGQYSPLSDIPESGESPRQLDFLETGYNSSSGTPASIRVGEHEGVQFDTLTAATRAVGQYLKRQSTGTPNSENSTQTLKLDSILENKTKKICARMYFETLVLKSYGFLDVQQEEPYGEINLKVTSKLKEQCCA